MKALKADTNYYGKTYLDAQPKMHSILKEWITELDIGDEYGCETVDEIECRSRDGFWAASHNLGGFDKTTWIDLYAMQDSSYGPNINVESEIEWGLTEALNTFKIDHAEKLEGIPEDKINYHDLYELKLGKLAEELSEYERSWLESPVHWGVRAMYEGADEDGVHTLMIYVSGSTNEYRGAFGKGSTTLGEFTVKFRSELGLLRSLEKIKADVENFV